jgi:energy-coupling factor transport system permease protein
VRHAPGPLLLLGAAACTLAFASDQPLVLAALTIGVLGLHFAALHRRRMYLMVGATIAAGITVLNPFVQANGDLILFALPDIPIFDLQVTLEELIAGAAMGLRAFVVTVAIGAVLAHVDPDRLLAVASRLVPRSALTASIAARMLPTLERDARALAETAALRGVSLRSGAWRRRTRTAGALAVPLVGSGLERSLDVAEAMAARGYGAGPRTRIAEPPATRTDLLVAVAGVPIALLAAGTMAGVFGDFAFYPALGPVATTSALIGAAVTLGALCATAWRLRG